MFFRFQIHKVRRCNLMEKFTLTNLICCVLPISWSGEKRKIFNQTVLYSLTVKNFKINPNQSWQGMILVFTHHALYWKQQQQKINWLWGAKIECYEDHFINWKCDGKSRNMGHTWALDWHGPCCGNFLECGLNHCRVIFINMRVGYCCFFLVLVSFWLRCKQ